MATATLTTTHSKHVRTTSRLMSNKHDPSIPNVVDDPVGNVKSLYAPAARAFVRRDVALTQTLLEAAFVTLKAHPPLVDKTHDPMANLRRKWDLLRITLETTVYTSSSSSLAIPGSTPSSDAHISLQSLPPSLQQVLQLQPQEVTQSLLSHSLGLWTPDSCQPSTLYLPISIVSALVFAALRVGCTDVSRQIIETWLAHRSEAVSVPNMPGSHLFDLSPQGYEKILDIYCLQVLPRLGEWDYAMEFLKYEPELSLDKRKHIYTCLKTLHTQVMTPALQIPLSSSSSTLSSGASSPGNQHANHDNGTSTPASASSRSTTTPRPSDHNGAPPRTGSASSTSSLSSQQTIRASQLAQHASSGKLANGTGLNLPATRLRSRSPRHRGPLDDASTANGDATTTTTTAEIRPRSMTGSSSRTAQPIARPHLAPPSDVLDSDSSSPSRGRGPAARLGVMDVLREWFRSYATIARGSRVPAAVIFVAVVLPLVAFIVRLRMRRRSAPPSGPTRLVAHGMTNSKSAAGTNAVRWLYDAVRDSVIMAGKGLV